MKKLVFIPKSFLTNVTIPLILFSIQGCTSLWNSGVEVKVTSIPVGQSDLKSGQVITLSESKTIQENGQRIKFPKSTQEKEKAPKYTAIVAAKFGNDIRLLDFFVTGVNEQPQLSFESTARSLVFINPLFLGLPFEKRVLVFQSIQQDSQFQNLVKLISNSSSLLNDNVTELSTDIALRVAKSQGVIIKSAKPNYADDKLLSYNLFSDLSSYLIPSVNAQADSEAARRFEYSITSKLTNDGNFGYPQWHGMELQATPSGIKIVGTSPLAQQVIVVPKDKIKTQNIQNDDYGGAKKLDADVIGETLLKPAETGIWDGGILKTATGGSQVEELLKPRNGGTWQPGEYYVLISAGARLNRRGEGQPYGAFDLNLGLYAIDIFALMAGYAEGTPTARAASIAKVLTGCQNKLASNPEDSLLSAINTINECIINGDSLKDIGEALGIQEIDEQVLQQLFRFQGEAWKKTVKKMARVINFADKTIATSRIAILGQYLNREVSKEFYMGSFSVVKVPYLIISPNLSSAEIEVACPPGNTEPYLKYQALDVVIELKCHQWGIYSFKEGGIEKINIKNYSTNAVEVKINHPGNMPVLSFPDEAYEFRVYFGADSFGANSSDDVKQILAQYWPNHPAGQAEFRTFYPYQIKMKLKSYSPNQVEKEVTINCSDTQRNIWGLQIASQCVPPGLRAEYQNTTRHSISVGIVGSSEPPIYLAPGEPMLLGMANSGGTGNVRSSSKEITLKIISSPPSK